MSSNITEFLADTSSDIVNTRPHAFVNWILFDNQFNYVAESSEYGSHKLGIGYFFPLDVCSGLDQVFKIGMTGVHYYFAILK